MDGAWIKEGVRCVCVTDFWQVRGIEGPSLKEIVTISEIYLNASGIVTLRFEEHYGWFDENTGERHGYNPRNFRPLVTKTQSEDAALFAPLLAKKKVRETT